MRFLRGAGACWATSTSSLSAVQTAALLFLISCFPGEAWAQNSNEVDWSSEARVFGANALLSGAVAGTAALIRRDPVLPAFARGVGGGSIVYAGKLVAAEPGPGKGLIGRQVASVGASIVGNEVAGRGSLDQVAFAVGPVRAYIGHEVDGVDWRLDVVAVAAIAVAVASGKQWDPVRSVSTGTAYFRDEFGGGFAAPGTLFLGHGSAEGYIVSHEKVHILQYDQSFLTLGEPFENWLARRVPSLAGTLGYLDFNLPVLAAAGYWASRLRRYRDSPWEREAHYLGRTRGQP